MSRDQQVLSRFQATLQAFKLLIEGAEQSLTAREWEALREILVIQLGGVDPALASRKAPSPTPR